jgi:hypothetical protein
VFRESYEGIYQWLE